VRLAVPLSSMGLSGATRNGTTPTVLLVHGAFADGSIWAGVVAELQGAGIGVIAVANPLRTLASDAAYVVSIATAIDGPVVLAGHCYGGAVITAAGAAAGNIAGLVYVAAYALEEGESEGRCRRGRALRLTWRSAYRAS
jgi:pimeloyl-ACP methyl ester carboxylesterase